MYVQNYCKESKFSNNFHLLFIAVAYYNIFPYLCLIYALEKHYKQNNKILPNL